MTWCQSTGKPAPAGQWGKCSCQSREWAGPDQFPFCWRASEERPRFRTLPAVFQTTANGTRANGSGWKGLSFNVIDQMRPRYHSTTVGGVDQGAGGIRVWSQFSCDDVTTTQEWFFSDLRDEDSAIYDCLVTVRNDREETLDEYGQFFACYTAWNQEVKAPVWDHTKRKWEPSTTGLGHFYWSSNGELVNFLDKGGSHLDYYVVAEGSPFEKLGFIPHCPRGRGKGQRYLAPSGFRIATRAGRLSPCCPLSGNGHLGRHLRNARRRAGLLDLSTQRGLQIGRHLSGPCPPSCGQCRTR